MNKITIDGQDYEVLCLDDIEKITHAKLAGGRVVECQFESGDTYFTELSDGSHFYLCNTAFDDLGIQPLRLIPRVPVEFVATFAKSGSDWYPLHRLNDGLAHQNSEVKKFRCVEVVE